MAKIIRNGKPPEFNKYEYECPNCTALIIFDLTDVQEEDINDYRDYPLKENIKFVTCPEKGCGFKIKWGNVVTKGRRI